jgi:DnaJ-class molecular chaperone
VGSIVGWTLGSLTLLFSLRHNRQLAAHEFEAHHDRIRNLNHENVLDFDSDGVSGASESRDIRNPYEVLKVSQEASISDIKSAYRDAIKRCHPDTVADRSDSIREAAEAEAQLINSAYEMIRNARGFN